MNLPSIKKGGRPGHALIQTKNAISFSYLPILIGLGNLPSCGGLVHCDRSRCPRPPHRSKTLLVHSGSEQIATWTVFPDGSRLLPFIVHGSCHTSAALEPSSAATTSFRSD